ncbi:MAG: hypothetical protein MI867_25720 [Pseudomonadales bacterium]|nr:hypothetical protein [Pseudomonadales bacterium]
MSPTELPRVINKELALESREQVVTQVLDLIRTVIETEDGYILNFGRQDEHFDLLVTFMKVERLCQPFLRMSLVSESNEGPIKLEVAGPSGTKDFMQTEYGLRRWLDS